MSESVPADHFEFSMRLRGTLHATLLRLPSRGVCALVGRAAQAVAEALQQEASRRYARLIYGGDAYGNLPSHYAGTWQSYEIDAQDGLPFVYSLRSDLSAWQNGMRRRRTAFAPADSLAELFDLSGELVRLWLQCAVPWCEKCGCAAESIPLELHPALREAGAGSLWALALSVEEGLFQHNPVPSQILDLYGAEYMWQAGRLISREGDMQGCSHECAVVLATARLDENGSGLRSLAKRAKELFDSGVDRLLILRVEADRSRAEARGVLARDPVCRCCGVQCVPVSREILEHRREEMLCHVCSGSGFLRDGMVCRECSGSGLSWQVCLWRMKALSLKDFSSLTFGALRKFISDSSCEGYGYLKRALHALSAFGFDKYLLRHKASVLSPGEKYRAALALLWTAGLSEGIVILSERASPLGADEFRACIWALRRLEQAQSTMVVVLEKDADPALFEWVCRVEEVEGRVCAACAEPNSFSTTLEKGRAPILGVKDMRAEYRAGVLMRIDPDISPVDLPYGCLEAGAFTVISGRSGCGKTRLLERIFNEAYLQARFRQIEKAARLQAAAHQCLAELVGVYEDITCLLAATREARVRGYNRRSFSISSSPLRCAVCRGSGFIFRTKKEYAPGPALWEEMAGECPRCKGFRFEPEVLQVRFRDLSIAHILTMSVKEACDFLGDQARLASRLARLSALSFGGDFLGKPRFAMDEGDISGIRLYRTVIKYLEGKRRKAPTLILFDQPLSGMQAERAHAALAQLMELAVKGHVVVCAENQWVNIPGFMEALDNIRLYRLSLDT